jgi:hypothetical protein
MATQELVVPRSIPITSPTSLDLKRRVSVTVMEGPATTTRPVDEPATKVDRRNSKRDEVDSIITQR